MRNDAPLWTVLWTIMTCSCSVRTISMSGDMSEGEMTDAAQGPVTDQTLSTGTRKRRLIQIQSKDQSQRPNLGYWNKKETTDTDTDRYSPGTSDSKTPLSVRTTDDRD